MRMFVTRTRARVHWAERNLPHMSFCWKLWAAAAVLSAPLSGLAATCTTQAELSTQDRDQLASTALRLAGAVAQQDAATLQSMLLPSEASSWPGIHSAADQAAPLMAGGQIEIRNLYQLDASTQTAPANTDFFCADKSGALSLTISMPSLPPGKYAVALVDAKGGKLAGQLGLILGLDSSGGGSTWKLGGLAAHQGVFDGHDGVWYWTRGRALAHADPWSAWYSYDAAHYLLIPIDFLTSPNLEKLRQEQSQIEPSPAKAFPLSLAQGDRTWKIDAVILNPALQVPDLAVVYESTGVTDPAALRTEATSVLSALLKTQPGLRANFHGLWAIAVNNGQRTPVMELPMAQIP
jgi:hypothetical protein